MHWYRYSNVIDLQDHIAQEAMVDGVIPSQSQHQDVSDVSDDDAPADNETELLVLRCEREEEIAETGDSTSELCLSNQMYIDSRNDKEVLYLLCIGLTDSSGTSPLFSIEQEPWSCLPKTSLRPRNMDYVREIKKKL